MTKAEVKSGDDRIRVITKVVVGSRLHGLDTPTSDWDYRGVHMHPIIDHISPFTTLKNTTWIEGDEDNTSYELSDFCKGAVHGNATYLEVFFSDQVISTSPIAEEMRDNWEKFIDTKKFIAASRGYAHNQWNKFYNFEDVGVKQQERTAKFAVAFLRVMWQCEQFLLTGKFNCSLKDCDLYPLMKRIKPMSREEIQKVLPEIVEAMSRMDMRLAQAEGDALPEVLAMKPDIEWIEQFLDRSYKSGA
jgi:predicted nucleotidyltransferase